ncbi:MAG: YqaA family protein [Bacillota bacterium]|jgi:membrane protein YqaA with SNARE-associated domain
MFSVENLVEYGPLGLVIVAFVESLVFPVPPDLILIPLCLATPRLSFWYAFLATFASVLGGTCGYFVGQRAGRPLIVRLFSGKTVQQVEGLFLRYGGWAVGVAAFTPIPFKVFTLGAGIFHVPFWTFLAAASFGRAGRFFLEGAAVFFFGERASQFLGRNFEIITLIITATALVLMTFASRLPKVRAMKCAVGGFHGSLTKAFHRIAKDPDTRNAVVRLIGAIILLSLCAVFLGHSAGPGVSALNSCLGFLAGRLAPVVSPLQPLWTVLQTHTWMASYAALAIIRFIVSIGGEHRARAVRTGFVILMACLMYAGLQTFLIDGYGGVFTQPNPAILSSHVMLCGAPFMVVGRRPLPRATILFVTGLACAGMLAFAIHTGTLEPAAAGAAFSVSTVASCTAARILGTGIPRRS